MSSFREMTPQRLQNGCSKKFQTLKHIIYHVKARDLEIFSNKLFHDTCILRENTSKTDFAKFLKMFIKSQNLNV